MDDSLKEYTTYDVCRKISYLIRSKGVHVLGLGLKQSNITSGVLPPPTTLLTTTHPPSTSSFHHPPHSTFLPHFPHQHPTSPPSPSIHPSKPPQPCPPRPPPPTSPSSPPTASNSSSPATLPTSPAPSAKCSIRLPISRRPFREGVFLRLSSLFPLSFVVRRRRCGGEMGKGRSGRRGINRVKREEG